jgi:hypothetical protein
MAISVQMYQPRLPFHSGGGIVRTDNPGTLGGIAGAIASGLRGYEEGKDARLERELRQAELERTRAQTEQLGKQDPEAQMYVRVMDAADNRLRYYPDDPSALRILEWAQKGLMRKYGSLTDTLPEDRQAATPPWGEITPETSGPGRFGALSADRQALSAALPAGRQDRQALSAPPAGGQGALAEARPPWGEIAPETSGPLRFGWSEEAAETYPSLAAALSAQPAGGQAPPAASSAALSADRQGGQGRHGRQGALAETIGNVLSVSTPFAPGRPADIPSRGPLVPSAPAGGQAAPAAVPVGRQGGQTRSIVRMVDPQDPERTVWEVPLEQLREAQAHGWKVVQ